jgi:hypothetical protein
MSVMHRLQAWMTPTGPAPVVAAWRLLLGASLVWFGVSLWPYLDELFTTSGLQMRDVHWFGLKPSIAIHAAWVTLLTCAVLVSVGRFVPLAAAIAWLLSMLLWWQNGLSRSPEMTLVHLSLLLLVLAPATPRWPWSTDRKGLPPLLRAVAWGAFAVVYGTSGYTKLTYNDSSWVDGSALQHVFNESSFRRLWYGDLFANDRFRFFLVIGTHASLALEAGAPLLAWFHRGRCLLWVASMGMHALALLFLNLTEVSVHMIVFHLVLIDERMWSDARTAWRRAASACTSIVAWLRASHTSAARIDPRMLQVWQRLLGLVVVGDALSRVSEIAMTMSNDGWQGGTSMSMEQPYVHLWWMLEAVGGVLLVCRRHMQATAGGLFLLLHVMALRAGVAQSGGDSVLRMLLLWGVVMGAFSRRSLSLLVLAPFFVQLVLMYDSSVLHKLQTTSWRNGTAACLALQADDYAQPLALWLRGLCSPWLMHWPVFLLEAIAVPLLIVTVTRPPTRNTNLLRATTALAMIAMHLVFALTLGVWLFSLASALLWVPFLPLHVLRRTRPPVVLLMRTPRWRLALGLILAVLVTVEVAQPLWTPKRLGWPRVVGIQQRWAMFARDNWDIRWVVVSQLRADGSVTDGHRHGLPVTWVQPAALADSLGGTRLHNLWLRVTQQPRAAMSVARSACDATSVLGASPTGQRLSPVIATRVIELRRPVDVHTIKPRAVIFSHVLAEHTCGDAEPNWPPWAMPPPRLNLRGEAAPLPTESAAQQTASPLQDLDDNDDPDQEVAPDPHAR